MKIPIRYIADDLKRIREQYIKQLAYEKWSAAGKPENKSTEIWLEAEQEYEAKRRQLIQLSQQQPE